MSEPAMSRRPRGRPSREDGPVAPNDHLLPLALATFADLGYEGASMRDLCRRLGVSHNLLHQRFGSKDRLWYTAVDHGFSALATDLVLRALAERFGDAPKTDDEVRRYATGVVDVLLSGISTGSPTNRS